MRIVGADFNIVVKYGMPRIISIVIAKLVQIIIVKLVGVIARLSRTKSDLLEVKLALPLFLCQIFSIILAHYVFVLSMKTYNDFNIMIFLSMLGILYTNFIMFWYFESIMAVFDLRVRSEAAEGKLKLQTQYYTLIEEHQKETIALRHDMRRHIELIKSLLNDNHNQILAEYVADLGKQVEYQSPIIQTPYPLISALLTDKKREALELEIDFRTNVDLVAEIKINPADLCVMLGNILDNAIEACMVLPTGVNKHVVVEIIQRDFKLLISVENSYDPNLKKPHGAHHGFGLKNVEKVVNTYGGLMDKKSENGVYKMRIIIP
jgi:signal transduction histidine kinase